MPEFDSNGDPISGVQKLPKIIEYDFGKNCSREKRSSLLLPYP